MKFKNLDFRYC